MEKKANEIKVNPLEIQLEVWRKKRELAMKDNNEDLRAYCSLYMENIKLQMQIERLMQPAIQKAMLEPTKMIAITNGKTIGEIESELLIKAQEYDKLTTMDKKLMQMSEDGKGFQVVRNAKGEPFQVIKQEEYMRLVDIENKYDNLACESFTGKQLKELYESTPNIAEKDTIFLTTLMVMGYEDYLKTSKAQAKELEELKNKLNNLPEKLVKVLKENNLVGVDDDFNMIISLNMVEMKLKQLCKEEVKE